MAGTWRQYFTWGCGGTINFPLLISISSFCLTLWYYTNMVTLTERLQQANTMNVLHADYSSPKTLEAVELIEDFIEEHGIDDYPFKFLDLRSQGSDQGRQLDRARRHLTQWFSRIQYFYEFGYLKLEALKKFPGAERARYFLDLVEPLEFVSRKTTGRKHAGVFDFLRQLYGLEKHRLNPHFVKKVLHLMKKSLHHKRHDGGERLHQLKGQGGEGQEGAGGEKTGEVDESETSWRSGRRKFGAYTMESTGYEEEDDEEEKKKDRERGEMTLGLDGDGVDKDLEKDGGENKKSQEENGQTEEDERRRKEEEL